MTPAARARRFCMSLAGRVVLVALLIGLSRGLFAGGLMALVAWTYVLWGSESSPLRHLLQPALLAIATGILMGQIVRLVLTWGRPMRSPAEVIFGGDTLDKITLDEWRPR